MSSNILIAGKDQNICAGPPKTRACISPARWQHFFWLDFLWLLSVSRQESNNRRIHFFRSETSQVIINTQPAFHSKPLKHESPLCVPPSCAGERGFKGVFALARLSTPIGAGLRSACRKPPIKYPCHLCTIGHYICPFFYPLTRSIIKFRN